MYRSFLLFTLFLGSATCHAGDLIWYQPKTPSVGTSVLDPKMDEQWREAASRTQVIVFTLAFLKEKQASNPAFLKEQMAPFLQRKNLKLAVESDTAIWASCFDLKVRNEKVAEDRALLSELLQAGIELSYFSVKNPIGIFPPDSLTCDYKIESGVRDIAWYFSEIQKAFPLANRPKLGLLDTLLAKGNPWVKQTFEIESVTTAFEKILAELRKNDIPLSYVHFFHPWESFREFRPNAPNTFETLRQTQTFFEREGIASGLTMVSVASISELQFQKRVLEVAVKVVESALPAKHFVLSGAEIYPLAEFPETPKTASTCPLTSSLRVVSRYLSLNLPGLSR